MMLTRPASEMTYTVSGVALNSTQTKPKLTRLTNERVGRLIAGQFSSSAGACEHSLSTIRHIGTRSRDLPNTYRTGRLHRCGLLLQTE